MTRRERLRRCYFNEPLDRPAVYSRTAYPPDDPSYDALKAYLEVHTELKEGWAPVTALPEYPVEVRFENYSAEFRRRVEVLHTPKGDLRRTRLESTGGLPGMDETFFISSREDAEKYLSLPEQRLTADAASFFLADARMGHRGIVYAGLGLNPAGFCVDLCGSENFALLSVTDRDVLHALCERRMRMLVEYVKFLLGRGVGPFFSLSGEEMVVPPLHGPRDFDDFNLRYDAPIIDEIHNGGGRVHIHCHGKLRAVFDRFVRMGCDVLHPFEGPPLGDLLPKEAKEIARGKMCLEGNIQISRMYEASPGEIREETRCLIRDAFDDGRGLIVSPTASPYIRGRGQECLSRYRAMVETVATWS